jgi:outer membrane protein TolC
MSRILIFILLFLSTNLMAMNINQILDYTKKTHPLFENSNLNKTINNYQLKQLKEEKNIINEFKVSGKSDETIKFSNFSTDKETNVDVTNEISKRMLSTGGDVSLSANYNVTDYKYPKSSSVSSYGLSNRKFHQNYLQLSYSQPLLKNFLGKIDKLPIKLKEIDSKISQLTALEIQESFLLETSYMLLDYLRLKELLKIYAKRIRIAKNDLQNIENKFRQNIVEKVEVINSRNILNLEMEDYENFRMQADALWLKIKNILALKITDIKFNLYDYQKLILPKEFSKKITDLRQIKIYEFKNQQYKQSMRAANNQRLSDLNLELAYGLSDGADKYGKSHDFDYENMAVTLNFKKQFGVSKNRSQFYIEKLHLAKNQLSKEEEKRKMQAEKAQILSQYSKLKNRILKLNVKQIKLSVLKTKEELKRFNQSKIDFKDVLNARQEQQKSSVRYINNLILFYKLRFAYLAASDQLIKGDINAKIN